MFKNKKIMGIAAAVLLAASMLGGTVAAYAASNVNQPDVQAASVDAAGANAELHDGLLAIAEKYGIDTSMTDGQIARIISYRLNNGAAQTRIKARDIALDLGIDISGMRSNQIDLAVKEKLRVLIGIISTREELEELAVKYGINTIGMTDEQILAALASSKESNASTGFGSPEKESSSNTTYGSPDKGGSVSRGTGSAEKENQAKTNVPAADKSTMKNNPPQPSDSDTTTFFVGRNSTDMNNDSPIIQRAGR